MKISAEISLYPLHEGYESIIIDYIKHLQTLPDLEVAVNGMSTQISGDMHRVFNAIEVTLTKTFTHKSQVVAVVKYLGKEVKPGEQVIL